MSIMISQYLDSYAKNNHHKDSCDDRCENDATYSIKEYHSKDKDGKTHVKKGNTLWFP